MFKVEMDIRNGGASRMISVTGPELVPADQVDLWFYKATHDTSHLIRGGWFLALEIVVRNQPGLASMLAPRVQAVIGTSETAGIEPNSYVRRDAIDLMRTIETVKRSQPSPPV